MARRLKSDELGEKGESSFANFCSDARLICNKLHKDRTGVDYLVEFKFPDTQDGPLDQRPQPPEYSRTARKS